MMRTKLSLLFVVVAILAILWPPAVIWASDTPGSSFAYQGRARHNGMLINGLADFRFTLWDSLVGGKPIGQPNTFQGGSAVMVTKGLFTVTLDFGPGAFAGEARYLQVEVGYPAGGGTFEVVMPRQLLNPAPYAIHALTGGEWTNNDGDIFYLDGMVGIGTMTPEHSLDVVGGSIRTDGQLISAVAEGTPPLMVTSPTLVQNLNASLLEGFGAAAFGRLSASQTWTGSNTFSSALSLGSQASSTSHAVRADRTISTGTGLSGGGNLTSNRTLSISSGGVGTTQLANNAVTEDKIASNAVTSGKIASNAVTSGKIANNAVTNAKIETASTSANPNSVVLRDGNGDISTNAFIGAVVLPGFEEIRFPHVRDFGIRNWDNQLQIVDYAGGGHRLVIDEEGRVGIGTTSPTSRLRVQGNITASGNCCGSSDARLKRNFNPIAGALDAILAMQAVRYEWRIDEYPNHGFEPGQHVGFIAQDVREIVPEVVVEESDGYLALDYGRLTTILVEAVKELHSDLETKNVRLVEQESQINMQNEQIVDLVQRITALEAIIRQLVAEMRE